MNPNSDILPSRAMSPHEMSDFRLIALDLDGTLLGPAGLVTSRTRKAVQKVVNAGYDVVYATGRNYTESKRIFTDVGHQDMGVFVSGAIVMDLRRREVLHRMVMNSELARQICGLIERLGHAALALQDHDVTQCDYLATSDVKLDQATVNWMKVTTAKIDLAGKLANHAHPCTLRVGLVARKNETARIQSEMIKEFGDRILVHSLFVPAYDVEVVEAFDPRVSKWEGIQQIAKNRNIAPSQIIAVGDDINDLSMIQGAGLGVAMGNAKEPVKLAAKKVIPSNADDGLAQFLESLPERV